MKVLRLVSSTPEPMLVEEESPRPEPRSGEVLIRVHAVAVTPTEVHWYGTLRTSDGAPRLAPVLGHEFSGEIVECGQGVEEFAVGQEVFGMNNWFAEGALAEYCVTTPELIVRKPETLSHDDAATVPISALTAWQGLFDHGSLQRGERVLIHGGAGAVGLFAVQLAHIHGAHVISTVSADNMDFVRSIGANEAIDYRGVPFEECVGDIDLVFDTVGPEVVRRSWQVLKPGGRFVTVAVESKWATDERVRGAFFIFEQDRIQLEQVSQLLHEGKLYPALDRVVPVSAATDAYRGAVTKRRPGKLVISPLEWSVPQASVTNTASS
ncbi:MAG TPA: NADP-dependent oxidoreductase [Bryobacteraceae bacterium]|nr:NADP-dependent oxidoreductase [Bryobacteraceae bacterium]